MKITQSLTLFFLGPLFYLSKYPLYALLGIPVFIFLTILTQVGGVIFWCSFACLPWLKWWLIKYKFIRFLAFQCTLYVLLSLFLIPTLAKISNTEARKALPLFASESFPVKPRNIFFCLLNRHYLTPNSYNIVKKVSSEFHQRHPSSYLIYYDANFPFAWKKITYLLRKAGIVKYYVQSFPLYPHLSHSDGKKLDLGFHYSKDAKAVNYTPSWIGYGALEAPRVGEVNVPCMCKNYWNYNFWLYFQFKKALYSRAKYQKKFTIRSSKNQRCYSIIC